MAIDFREGYEFFQKNAGALFGADIATEFGTSTVNYVEELTSLEDSINAFKGYQTPSAQLKGDVAEFWHAGTFNTNAALDRIREIRNYWAHQCYLDYIYINNDWQRESKFQRIANRLSNEHNRIYNLHHKLQDLYFDWFED